MTDGAARDNRPEGGVGTEAVDRGRSRARLLPVSRRGPVLQAAKGADPDAGIFGVDLTAGCGLGCTFCHIRGSSRFPGEGKILFDPATTERLLAALGRLPRPPQVVVLSPSSDPLPADRDVRAETFRVVRTLLERGIAIRLMTRGRIGRPLREVLAAHADLVRVGIGLTTLSRPLSRALEPNAAVPEARLRSLGQLVKAGVAVEARLEPLIADLTDTRANLAPLFQGLARAGVRDVVAHYLFLQPAMMAPLAGSLAPFGWSEKVLEAYQGGPAFAVGSVGTTKHLPIEPRRIGLARLLAWGAEFGLEVRTGHAQNPDLPLLEPATRIAPPAPRDRSLSPPSRSLRQAAAPEPVAAEELLATA